MQNQFFLHQYWKFMHFSPFMPLARRPSLSSTVVSYIDFFTLQNQMIPLFKSADDFFQTIRLVRFLAVSIMVANLAEGAPQSRKALHTYL